MWSPLYGSSMSYNPDIHRRRSVRLKGYDYSWTGAYFVTIVTQGRVCCFGDVAGGGAGQQLVSGKPWDGNVNRYLGN